MVWLGSHCSICPVKDSLARLWRVWIVRNERLAALKESLQARYLFGEFLTDRLRFIGCILFVGGGRTWDLHDQNPDVAPPGVEHWHLHVVEIAIGDVWTIRFPIFDSGEISSRRMNAQPGRVAIRDQDHPAPTRWDNMQSHPSKIGMGREHVQN